MCSEPQLLTFNQHPWLLLCADHLLHLFLLRLRWLWDSFILLVTWQFYQTASMFLSSQNFKSQLKCPLPAHTFLQQSCSRTSCPPPKPTWESSLSFLSFQTSIWSSIKISMKWIFIAVLHWWVRRQHISSMEGGGYVALSLLEFWRGWPGRFHSSCFRTASW